MGHAIDRRRFITLAGMVLGVAPFHALACRSADIGVAGVSTIDPMRLDIGYGPLQPVKDETTGLPLLHLPADFRYVSFGWTGDPAPPVCTHKTIRAKYRYTQNVRHHNIQTLVGMRRDRLINS